MWNPQLFLGLCRSFFSLICMPFYQPFQCRSCRKIFSRTRLPPPAFPGHFAKLEPTAFGKSRQPSLGEPRLLCGEQRLEFQAGSPGVWAAAHCARLAFPSFQPSLAALLIVDQTWRGLGSLGAMDGLVVHTAADPRNPTDHLVFTFGDWTRMPLLPPSTTPACLEPGLSPAFPRMVR